MTSFFSATIHIKVADNNTNKISLFMFLYQLLNDFSAKLCIDAEIITSNDAKIIHPKFILHFITLPISRL